jgi:hypothetical protein
MIIYKDILTGDTLLSDAYKVIDVPGSVLWEVNCNWVKRRADDGFERANPSTETGDDDDDGDFEMVLDIQEDFALYRIEHLPRGEYRREVKSYLRTLNSKLAENGVSEEEVEEFQAGAVAALEKILDNYDDYEVFTGASMDRNAMYVLIGHRQDGKTPFATIWKDGLVEEMA